MDKNLFTQDVSNLNSVGQFFELYKQINNAIKAQKANPGKTAKELIAGNIVGNAVENYLISKNQKLKKPPIRTMYLHEIFHEEEIFVDESGTNEGSGILYSSINTGYFFEDRNLSKSQKEKTQVKVFEIYKKADYMTVFKSLNEFVKGLCMTKEQIKSFCEKHKNKLAPDSGRTLFLFVQDGDLFVAKLFFDQEGFLYLVQDHYDCAISFTEITKLRMVVSAKGINPPKA